MLKCDNATMVSMNEWVNFEWMNQNDPIENDSFKIHSLIIVALHHYRIVALKKEREW